MNKNMILRGMAGSLILCGLSACGTIKSWFPDKERDYQFTSEIPELIVPDDLKNKGLAGAIAPEPAVSADEAGTVSDAVASNPEAEAVSLAAAAGPENDGSGVSKPEPPVSETAEINAEPQAVPENAEPQQAALPETHATGGVSSLQIDQAKMQATRMVGRALTRQKVEIVERNIDKGYFYVKYDPNAVEARDESIWDEFNFLFGDDPSQEREYRISVRGVGAQMSEVTVRDEQGKALSTSAANALLKLITEGINQAVDQDKAADEPEQPAAEPVRQPITENPAIHD